MKMRPLPLAYRLFAAIGLTALLVVTLMASLVANNMRDGFSRYLLREELDMHAPLAEAVGKAYDAKTGGWPAFGADADLWRQFVIDNSPRPPHLAGLETDAFPEGTAPPEGSAPTEGMAPPDGDLRPKGPPPIPIDQRLVLLNAQNIRVAGITPLSGQEIETIAISAPDAAPDAAPIGWLALVAPGEIQNTTDAFFLRSQLHSLIYAAALALLLSGIAAALLARQFLVPIRALERGAKRLADGEYSARIPSDRSDELGQLIIHYNALAESLETAERAQRQWVSDTSHELQTPLAVLRAHIEAVQDGVRPADARTLGAMADALERLTRLVADLRLLSAWREDVLMANRGPADLARIAHAAVNSVSAGFDAAGLDLTTQIAGPIRLDCDASRIRQVIDNLLSNAMRYTDAPGQVRLRAWGSGGRAYLTLDDTAPAPPDSSMPLLFDRFHRADPSRSRIKGGSGLGLAICKAIVEAHGGTITASVSRLGGLHIQVTLPAGERK